jgi:CheY-like chemotaxis protein
MNDSSSGPIRVLIVEDEVLVRMFAVDSLEDAGFKVEEAANGAEAMEAVTRLQERLAAVVIDLGLPDRPGDEVAAEIRGALANVPILIASGRSEKELRERFAVDSRVAVMVKPYTGPMLIDALASLGVMGRPRAG